ncbi:MAG: imelysin family protein [Paraglaciecola sp.]|uniref:imelysin family protein n=1 Tax=Paraglaciecola sp. TaxID=1920173 RepID=UPI0032666D26
MVKLFHLKRDKLVLNIVVTIVFFSLTACGESSSSTQGIQFSQNSSSQPATDDFNQTLLLESLTDNVIVPTYEKFAELTILQESAISNYCDALTDQASNISEMQITAQQSWRELMAVWQMAEVMQIGPLVENNNSLRNKIYSWPNVSQCAVDQDVVLSEQGGYDISTRTPSRKGLDAIEYLLFNQNLDHSCTVFGTDPQGWNNRIDEDRAIARCNFAKVAAIELIANSQSLVTEWNGTSSEEGYADTLKDAGQIESAFADVHDAVNDVSDALFYVDTLTKDAKLATPLGIFVNDCGLVPCGENVESQFAFNSLDNILNNIRAINMIFLGGDDDVGIGFEDYLIDVGADDTAQKMRDDLTNVTQFIEDIQQTLTELLEQNPEQVQHVHDELKKVTDTLKTDFIQGLALELPATSAGDND